MDVPKGINRPPTFDKKLRHHPTIPIQPSQTLNPNKNTQNNKHTVLRRRAAGVVPRPRAARQRRARLRLGRRHPRGVGRIGGVGGSRCGFDIYIYTNYTSTPHAYVLTRDVKPGLVDPDVIAGRMGGRVLRAVGLTGKNAER